MPERVDGIREDGAVSRSTGSRTLVAVHAHPDDEALLTAGTMAKAAAAGHRVVLVLATNGDLGLTDAATAAGDLGAQRLAVGGHVDQAAPDELVPHVLECGVVRHRRGGQGFG